MVRPAFTQPHATAHQPSKVQNPIIILGGQLGVSFRLPLNDPFGILPGDFGFAQSLAKVWELYVYRCLMLQLTNRDSRKERL